MSPSTSIFTRRDHRLRTALALFTASAVCGLWGNASAIAADGDSVALTIYSTATPGAVPPEAYRPIPGQNRRGYNYRNIIPGYAIVKQERQVQLEAGRSSLRFADVAAYIEPTTVSFTSLTDPEGTKVLEQSYEFDLVSTEKLMRRYLDRRVTATQIRGDGVVEITGKLLSTDGGLVLQTDSGGVQILSSYSDVQLPDLPGGLITKPTLVWDVMTKTPGAHRVRVSYETKAMTWWADYNVTYSEGKDANSGLLDIGAWVTIINQSGASYQSAKLKLIAGDVHRAPVTRGVVAMQRRNVGAYKMDSGGTGFEEKSFFEYHLYTLGRPATLSQNATKQIELFTPARGVPCEKVLVYYGLAGGFRGMFPNPMTDRNFGVQSNKKVDIYLRFKNEEKVGMGMPLPSGRIRVTQLDKADGSLEFIGEDTIDHTPKNEQVLIKLGSAFDIVGERKQTDFTVDMRRDTMDETIEITLRNHKEEPVRVIVKENPYRWVNWKITESSHRYEKIDSRTVHFAVTVPKDGETKITYTVHYSW